MPVSFTQSVSIYFALFANPLYLLILAPKFCIIHCDRSSISLRVRPSMSNSYLDHLKKLQEEVDMQKRQKED